MPLTFNSDSKTQKQGLATISAHEDSASLDSKLGSAAYLLPGSYLGIFDDQRKTGRLILGDATPHGCKDGNVQRGFGSVGCCSQSLYSRDK